MIIAGISAGLFFCAPLDTAHSAYPGANGMIAYALTDPNTLDRDIWVMNSDDTGHVNITSTLGNDGEPVWSPDGTKIAFSSDRELGNTDIWVMDADGANPIRLTDDGGVDTGPTWSPNGSKIAFSSDRDGDADIYVMDADGANETNITNTTVPEIQPSWAPSGSQIAYTRGGEAAPCGQEIFVMNADGTAPTPLTCEVQARTPDWSPDGTIIAFGVGEGTGVSVWLMNADGSQAGEITAPNSFDPAWSPDGTTILFHGIRSPSGPPEDALYTIDLAGGDETAISEVDGVDPNWQPLPPDTDADGFVDPVDNCPSVPNPEQVDDDGDSVGNACDNCSGTANADQTDTDDDEMGDACDPDDDADGVDDGADNCPLVLNAGQENGDGDLHGNACDNCPGVSSPDQADTDGDQAGNPCDAPGQGNVDCDGAVNSIDALKLLRYSALLSVLQSEPCMNLGLILPSGRRMGDVDCSFLINSIDALKVLRAVAEFNVQQPAGCPPIKP
jgi:Tol biopolymer transport system component